MSDSTIAASTGIPLAFVRAIRAVESNGSATAVRFEPHVFWRIRKGLDSRATGPQIRDALSAAELAQVPYTPGNADWRAAHGLSPCRISRAASCSGSETDAAAFQRAYAVDPATAIRATSFGAFQVLGGHLLGIYPDPARAVAAFRANPATVSEQLLVHWINANPEAKAAAQRGDIYGWVSRFNGCSDCTAYETKFRAALARGRGGGMIGGAILLIVAGLAWKWFL